MSYSNPLDLKKYKQEYAEKNKTHIKEYQKLYQKEYKHKSKEAGKITTRNKKLKALYGISIEDYTNLFLIQKGCCAICDRHQSNFKMSLSVDHCHSTGKVRGLLCHACNLTLGMVKDSTFVLKKAISYLEGVEPVVRIKGVEIRQPVKIKTKDYVTLGKKGEVRFIESSGQSLKGKDILSLDIETKKALLGKEGAYTPLKLRGKITEQYKQLSKAEGLGETPSFSVYKTRALTRKVSPVERKVIPSQARVFVEKGEPQFKVSVESPITIKKDLLKPKIIRTQAQIEADINKNSKEIVETLKRVYGQEQILKTEQKIATISIPKPIEVKPLTIMEEIPSIKKVNVISQIKVRAEQKGLGDNIFTGTAPEGRIGSLTGGRFKDLGTTESRFKDLVLSREETKVDTTTKGAERFFTGTGTELGLKPLEKVSEEEKQKERQRQKQLLNLLQRQKEKPRLRQTSQQISLQEEPTKFKVDIPKILGKPTKIERIEKRIRESPKLFEVFGKRFGKDIKILETPSKRKAEEETIKFLKGTLGRSARILESGKALEFKELKGFGVEFRPAKKESTRIVQKAKFSLGTGSEIKEIQYFKRKKGRI